jgi:hypothetical protein
VRGAAGREVVAGEYDAVGAEKQRNGWPGVVKRIPGGGSGRTVGKELIPSPVFPASALSLRAGSVADRGATPQGQLAATGATGATISVHRASLGQGWATAAVSWPGAVQKRLVKSGCGERRSWARGHDVMAISLDHALISTSILRMLLVCQYSVFREINTVRPSHGRISLNRL